jgi:hypothetical protein
MGGLSALAFERVLIRKGGQAAHATPVGKRCFFQRAASCFRSILVENLFPRAFYEFSNFLHFYRQELQSRYEYLIETEGFPRFLTSVFVYERRLPC